MLYYFMDVAQLDTSRDEDRLDHELESSIWRSVDFVGVSARYRGLVGV